MAERVDDLQYKGYKIIQDTEGFCFGIDAVLLSNFAAAAIHPGQKALDLCSGNGIVPILLAAKTRAAEIHGLEIQEPAVNLARRSVGLNHEEERIFMMQGDLKEIRNMGWGGSMDVVTANPPYMNTGLLNPSGPKQIARHEVLCSFHDVAFAAAHCLKSNGKFFLVHRPNRLMDILTELEKQKLEPKRLQMVHPFRDREANLFLLEAVKGAGRELRVLEPLVIYEREQVYTEQLLRFYGSAASVSSLPAEEMAVEIQEPENPEEPDFFRRH